jgi:putative hydrolase of the HAD superfamily
MPITPPESTATAIQNAPPRIDAVLFDFGQVLSNAPNAAAWAHISSIAGVDKDRLQEAYWAFRHDYDRATLNATAYWNAVAKQVGFQLDEAKLAALNAADVDLWTDLNLPMVEWVARLQHAGIRTGILSNIGDAIADGIIAKLAWLSAFDHCTWSHALFMAKPEPAIYLKTAEALHTAREHILFIDDREDNIAAAAALGFQAIQYTTHAAFERQMRERGLTSLLNIGLASGTAAAPSQPALEPARAAK